MEDAELFVLDLLNVISDTFSLVEARGYRVLKARIPNGSRDLLVLRGDAEGSGRSFHMRGARLLVGRRARMVEVEADDGFWACRRRRGTVVRLSV